MPVVIVIVPRRYTKHMHHSQDKIEAHAKCIHSLMQCLCQNTALCDSCGVYRMNDPNRDSGGNELMVKMR